jgi:isopenicillin N synthase-like dioxygenase
MGGWPFAIMMTLNFGRRIRRIVYLKVCLGDMGLKHHANVEIFDIGLFGISTQERKIELGAKVDLICRKTGFLAISNHGVAEETIEAVWNKSCDFFDLPMKEKLAIKGPYKGYPYGYIGPEAEALAKSNEVDAPGDLKESFNGGPLRKPDSEVDPESLEFCYADTIWPTTPLGFVEAWSAYYIAMEDLAARIMRVFAVALGLDEGYFDQFITCPISALRALNYPEQHGTPKRDQIRAGAHTDYGSLTILLPQNESRGLEILSPEGEWVPITPIPGTFIINIGDLMARWTNDRWVSTLHRVINPPADQGGMNRRQSLAFFHQPNWSATIKTLDVCVKADGVVKYHPVKSGPYLMSKFKAANS